MKNLHYLFYIIVVIVLLPVSSCSNDDDGNPVTVEKEEELKLTIDKAELNVMEVTQIRLDSHSSIFKLFNKFDSIKWGVPNIYEEKYIAGQMSYTGNINVGFCLPGIYNAVISGYRDNKIVESDTLEIKCFIDGDFFNIKWKDNDKPGNYGVGGHNNLAYNYKLGLTHVKGINPYAHLEYYIRTFGSKPNTDSKKQYAESRQLFYDYITDLYGKPVCDYKGDDFVNTPYLNEYHKRFTVALNGLGLGITYTPITIWDTPKSHVVLLGAVDNDKKESYHYYTVIAEPRKK